MELLFIAPQTEAEVATQDVQETASSDAPVAEAVKEVEGVDAGIVELGEDGQIVTDSLSKKEYNEEMAANSGGEAVTTEPDAGNPWTFWIMIGAMILIMYFFMWRPERKRRKQMEQFRQGLKKGDKVITAGGIYGTVKEVNDTSLLLELEGHTTLRVDKGMVVADPSNGTAR